MNNTTIVLYFFVCFFTNRKGIGHYYYGDEKYFLIWKASVKGAFFFVI